MTADPRMSPAEFAVRRHLLGLTSAQLADALSVHEQTVRRWESGRDPIPYAVPEELAMLIREHTALVHEMVKAGTIVSIPRRSDAESARWPGGWYVAAAARAVAIEPDLMLEWGGCG